MSWAKLFAEKRVAAEPTSKGELDELRAMVAGNLAKAAVPGVSVRGQYAFAYNAACLMATVTVRANGYRVTTKLGHQYTFRALQAVDPTFDKVAAYFDDARDKRYGFSYDVSAAISDADADNLLQTVEQFQEEAEAWITARHPSLSKQTDVYW